MTEEIRRNFLGFMLLIAGVGMVFWGKRAQIDKLTDTGIAYIGMAGLALSVPTHSKPDPKGPDPKDPAASAQ